MRWLGFSLILAFFAAAEAKAQVVALGDSSTRGYLLALSDAWPAKLEVLLHQRGYNVSVANEGINGDNSEGMLSRLDSAAPNGTRVVIFGCCGNDNKNRNNIVADHAGNIRTIISRLRARGIAVIYSSNSGPSDLRSLAARERPCAEECTKGSLRKIWRHRKLADTQLRKATILSPRECSPV